MRLEAPRIPDGTLIAAPTHIGFAFWHTKRGKTQNYNWIIAVDSQEACRIVEHQAEGSFPMNQIIESLEQEVDSVGNEVWINLPASRVALANRLYSNGFPVSVGYSKLNRASDISIAVKTMRRQNQKTSIAAKAVNLSHSDPGVSSDLHSYWWPNISKTAVPGLRSLVVATDASKDAPIHSAAAIAAISNNGDYELAATQTTANICELELDALTIGLELIAQAKPNRATLLSDNHAAIKVASHIINTGFAPTKLAGISNGSVKRFSDALEQICCPVDIRWVKGHAGHQLHDDADEIATLGRLATRFPSELVDEELNTRLVAISRHAFTLVRSDCLRNTTHLDSFHNTHEISSAQRSWSSGDSAKLSNTINDANPFIANQLLAMYKLDPKQ